MAILVNGAPADVAPGPLDALLAALDYGDMIVATAVNGEFVPAEERARTEIRDGDRVEILAPMQGG